MSTATAPRLMTTEELLALPDDGVERWLIRGELREGGMTRRNRWHSRIEARLAHLLGEWLDRQPEPRGAVYSGEAGVILRRDPDTTVGVNVAYVSAEIAAAEPDDTTMLLGVPTLAVEVLSPTNTEEQVNEKLDAYRDARVPLVWVVDPHLRTVLALRPGVEPVLFNVTSEIDAEPHLPGFRVPVGRIFAR
jgi:Uma2 family endonuclease